MLVLDRNVGQSLMIGDEILVEVVAANGKQVRLGITAPLHVDVFREEIYKRILRERLGGGDRHASFASTFTATELPGSLDTTGIPIYRRIRHAWTKPP